MEQMQMDANDLMAIMANQVILSIVPKKLH
jgi:hypothetical protein